MEHPTHPTTMHPNNFYTWLKRRKGEMKKELEKRGERGWRKGEREVGSPHS
jgi:hypothetical protein